MANFSGRIKVPVKINAGLLISEQDTLWKRRELLVYHLMRLVSLGAILSLALAGWTVTDKIIDTTQNHAHSSSLSVVILPTSATTNPQISLGFDFNSCHLLKS